MVNNKPENPNNQKAFFTSAEIAKVLGVSRTAVFKKIQSGQIKAIKVGRNYIIPRNEFETILGQFVAPEQKKDIEAAVKKAVGQYAETFRLLGKE